MYTLGSRVRYSEVDEEGNLTLTGIMNYMQDCSTFQSEDNGLGVSYLTNRNKAWWLSSWQIVIDRYPVMGEEISVCTWPYDFKGFYGYRNFIITDQNGNNLVKANSVWFLFDTEKGRPAKIEADDIKGYGLGLEKSLDMEYAPRKIDIPDHYEIVDSVMVSKHHLDTNHHVNNAKYVEIAREVLPEELEVSELRVEYKKAAILGDLIYPHVSRTKEGYIISLCDQRGTVYAVVCLRGTTERK